MVAVFLTLTDSCLPILVAAPSKALFCGRSVPGVAGSNPAEGMNVCLLRLYFVLSCVGRRLCDGLITRPEESCHVSNCVCLRNLNTKENKAQITFSEGRIKAQHKDSE
jgi:hypothetical protein